MSFSRKILDWYEEHKRPLPWRQTSDPYKIWLSEILLQQTRVAQGLPYYEKFITHFPTVYDLARADEETVLKLWQGLGYYSRARNLHATARTIAEDYEGRFPDNHRDLMRLKGIGDYTASAIASISFGRPEPVVDGNVYRVLARYFGVELAIDSPKGVKYFKELAREVMDMEHIRDYNQGLMEFGALHCKPKNPECETCPLNNSCHALQKGQVSTLPVKGNKTRVRERFLNYLFVRDPLNRTLFRKREGRGIWQNLYEFPFVEADREIEKAALQKEVAISIGDFRVKDLVRINNNKIIHKLSHQHLHVNFWMVPVDRELPEGIPVGSLKEYPVPVLIADFIEKYLVNSNALENA
ncbi:A/G-specific adenine glycosylase [Lentiprolixibacter aurantiacus]|uniref:Adenine DNA glycosylase n=1 Tax=Lentiprolixibacter aurantiacus TaxID=2993939 RepID=A0AAE3MIY0_9FLAO|nr:A/G-specific adenine glycosylase [Lentiprolixibacter aurantiacus]MCX2718279.1 A/G-specific adenine glycosylase [Lentiprolixibacter aurantiacus]